MSDVNPVIKKGGSHSMFSAALAIQLMLGAASQKNITIKQ